MRPLLLHILLIPAIAFSQQSETFYDFNWKPCEPSKARFYSTVQKTDSGWLREDYFLSNRRLQMKNLYADAECNIANGTGLYYYANGQLQSAGRRVKGKREGVCVSYHSNGMMSDSGYYQNDKPLGNYYRWHRNGFPADSLAWINDSTQVQYSWFDDGAPSAGGFVQKNELHGRWKYYHHNGQVSGELLYEKGKVVEEKYYQEDGTPLADPKKAFGDAHFKNGGNKGWVKYMEKSVYWPQGVVLTNTEFVTIGISYTINEEGKPVDVEVYTPFNSLFDDIAVKIIRNSPAWVPAVLYNRKVKQHFRQPVTFVQE